MSNKGAINYHGRPNLSGLALLPSTTVAAAGSGTGTAPQDLGEYSAIAFELAVTAAAAGSGDTLDVYVQTTLDGGANWVDIVHFAQVLGNGGAKTYFDKLVASLALTEFEIGSSLAASSLRHLFGDQLRVRWVAAGGGAAFTFAVFANAQA